ncbi:MAG: SRPBCC family protein [Actinobacteria bacterium]|nr:SRPBCC family protein [Actinomycetota bacterium]
MSEQAKEQIRIDASVESCFATLVDFASYPEWAGDLKEVTVVETDADNRAVVVEFRAAAMGRSTTYQLRYDYSAAPNRLGWELVEGDLPRELDGAYVLTAVDGDSSTDVVYELAIDLVYPIPGFVKRRAEGRIIKTALSELKARVEGSPRPSDDD